VHSLHSRTLPCIHCIHARFRAFILLRLRAATRVNALNNTEWTSSKPSSAPCARGSVRTKPSSPWQTSFPSSKHTQIPTTQRENRTNSSHPMARNKTRLQQLPHVIKRDKTRHRGYTTTQPLKFRVHGAMRAPLNLPLRVYRAPLDLPQEPHRAPRAFQAQTKKRRLPRRNRRKNKGLAMPI